MMRTMWLLLAAVGCRAGGSEAPGMVEHFYADLRNLGVSGAPTPEQLARLAPYLGDSLQRLLSEARREHDADESRAPEEKPSFAEGDLFSSLFEGPTNVRTESRTGAGPEMVLAHMTYTSADPPTSWTDTAVIGIREGRPVIEDIRYGGDWEFALRGSLLAQLSGARAGSP